jgi:hypothetical protein
MRSSPIAIFSCRLRESRVWDVLDFEPVLPSSYARCAAMIARIYILLFLATLGLGVEPAAAAARIRLPKPEWTDVVVSLVRQLPGWGLIYKFLNDAQEPILKFLADPLMMQLVLGAVVILVGAVLVPDLPVSPAKAARSEKASFSSPWTGTISFKGAPRYAVILAGLSIVFTALWRSYPHG